MSKKGEEKVWLIEARTYVRARENVEELERNLKALGLDVEKREIIFEYDL